MERSYHLDNIKVVLIVLVVFGHLIEPIRSQANFVSRLYDAIYLFHMPAFVFVAGFTSKSYLSRQSALGLLLVYGIFQTIFVLLFTRGYLNDWLHPYWLMWFIFSLFCWRLIVPLFERIPFPVVIAVAIALTCGFVAVIGNRFSLSRTLVFLPFFMLGYFHGRSIVAWCDKKRSVATMWGAAILGLLAMFAAGILIGDANWLYGADSYHALNAGRFGAAGTRAVLLAGATICVIAVFILVPARQFSWSQMGGKVLSVYLLHGLFIVPARPWLSDLAAQNIGLALLIMVLLTFLLTRLLASDALHNLIYPVYRFDLTPRLKTP